MFLFLWYQAAERESTAEEKVKVLTERVNQAGENLRDLEAKDEDASEREQVNEEKVSFLQVQVKEILATAEDQERKIPQLERTIDQMNTEIDDWNAKVEEVKKEMDDMEALVGESISDDDDDFVAKKKTEPKAAPVKETRRGEVEDEDAPEDGGKEEEDDERKEIDEKDDRERYEDDDDDEDEDEDWNRHTIWKSIKVLLTLSLLEQRKTILKLPLWKIIIDENEVQKTPPSLCYKSEYQKYCWVTLIWKAKLCDFSHSVKCQLDSKREGQLGSFSFLFLSIASRSKDNYYNLYARIFPLFF